MPEYLCDEVARGVHGETAQGGYCPGRPSACCAGLCHTGPWSSLVAMANVLGGRTWACFCLLYTSDAADDM
eukprot:4162107-Lingulodinium_polyedra.AAC.1